jgi:MHS family proline/betaine transporter-like MFS transporter
MNNQDTVLLPGMTVASQGQIAHQTSRRAVAAAAVVNALEWYDFTVYAFFAVYLAQNFFPKSSPSTQLIQAFLAFGLGFVVRPLGAVFLGAYGDRIGRKAALVMTIVIMAVGTLLIVVCPPYSVIGLGAPVLIVIARMLQGFSAGGEVGGATAFLVEHAPPEKKGVYAAWLQASMGICNILGALVATILTLLISHVHMTAWGWRIPFILGLTIAPLGLWLLQSLEETPQFQAEQARRKLENKPQKTPLLKIVQEYPRQLVIGFGLSILWAVSTYTLIIFLPTFVQRSMHFQSSDAFLAALIGNCFMVVGCLLSGRFSDRFGRWRTMAVGALGLLIGVYPLFDWLSVSHTLPTLIAVQIIFCLLVAVFVGVAPSALSDIFPVEIRSTGMALSYNIAVTIFGGFAPAILTWLTERTGGNFAPAWYVMIATLIALLAIAAHSRSSKSGDRK